MGLCFVYTHLCWASELLGVISVLGSSCWLPTQILMLHVLPVLALPLPGLQTVKDPDSCTLNRTVGESVQMPLNSSLGPNIREIEWNWNCEGEKKFLVSWKPNTPNPEWYDLEDKHKHRFNLTETYFLSIVNLTMEMSGLYAAEIKFNSGKSQKEAFRLCVYEPIPHPQILIHSSSSTSGWCNVSLECGTPGTTENLTVTWLSEGLPREPEQRGTPAAAPNSRNLSLSLLLSQGNRPLTCVVSNPADQKNATLELGSICPHRGSFQSTWLWIGLFATVLVVSLGAGVWIWKRKKIETERAVPGSPAPPLALLTEDSDDRQDGGLGSHDLFYADISSPKQPKSDTDKSSCHAQSPKLILEVHTVYEKIQRSPEPKGDT